MGGAGGGQAGGGGAMSTGGAGGLGGSGGKIAGTGGAAGAAGGGTGGSGGAAGAGGTGTGGGTAGSGGSAVTCSGALAQATAPVIVAATLQCTALIGVEQVSVAAESANTGSVAMMGDHPLNPAFFFDISPSAVQVQPLGTTNLVSLPANAAGAFGAIIGGPDATSVSWSSRSGASTTGKLTPTSVMDTVSSSRFLEGAVGPDGTPYALFVRPDSTLGLLSRPASGSAFTTAAAFPMLTPYTAHLAVDAGKVPHFLAWVPLQGLVDSPQGQALVTLFPSTLAQPPTWRLTRPGGLDFAVSALMADAVHVLRRGTGSTFDDIPIPGTPATSAPVSSLTYCTSSSCPNGAQMGDFASSAALAEAGDGTLWLVTIRDHLDRTIPWKYANSEACQCQATLVPADDHSTRTLAVQKIAPGATAPSAVLWSQDLALQPWTTIQANDRTLDVSFFGSSLFLTVVDSTTTVSYDVVDTTGLH
jgi:hypothetical protein